MKIVTVSQMLDLERRSAEAGAPPQVLMENAGTAIAQAARDFLGSCSERSIIVLIGPGNNGGDGLVAARHLHDWGAHVRIFLFKRQIVSDRNFTLALERGIDRTDLSGDDSPSALENALASADLVIDAIFGTGKTRPIEGVVKQALERVEKEKTHRPALRVLAIDLPSGLNADTGAVDPACLTADLTVTLGYPKIGLFQFPGAARVGRLQVVDIGIPPELAQNITTELITPASVRPLLPERPLDANKGTFGRLLVMAGSINYIGAPYLACAAAMRVGTGLVTLATPASILLILAAKLTETTYLPLPEKAPGAVGIDGVAVVRERLAASDAVLIGCGLGQQASTIDFLSQLLLSGPLGLPAVIDADGLNILAGIPKWWEKLKTNTVLTPHPGEMSRLTGKSVAEIQRNRLATAREAAQTWGQTVVLKGAHTVIAAPGAEARICGSANPGLASAGTGDVLAGIIAGLMAQGLPPFAAAETGVYLHATAGELVKGELGDTGMVASDLLSKLPLVIKGLKLEVKDR